MAAVLDLDAARAARTASGRAVAREQHVPESTLRGWAQRAHQDQDTLPEPVRRFFETPEGVQLLHRIVLAALFVMVLLGGSGVPLVRLFLVYTGLDKLVACSDSHLHARARALRQALNLWGAQQRKELAVSMPPRVIGLIPDETFPDGMLLVAMEAVSGFLLVEQHSERRDADTWHAALRNELAGLPVTVVQVTSDEAAGLRALAEKKLGVQHNSDVFHGQNELCKGIFGALRGVLRKTENALAQARKTLAQHLAARAKFLTSARSPGRPPDWQARIDRAAESAGNMERLHHAQSEYYAALRNVVREVGEAVSPIDLRTGAWQSPEAARARLERLFTHLTQRVDDLELGERAEAAIAKAQRLVSSWVGSIAWWQCTAEARLVAAELAPEVTVLMRAVLLPAALLEAVRKRAPNRHLRAAHRARLAEVLAPLREPSGLWSRLSPALRATLGMLARECASQWQPSSSALEGRNGYLSLRHHHLHSLPPEWLQTLTVLHNYVIQRRDGTTAAERFFGRKPGDLFEHLVAVMPLPSRPRVRARDPVPDLFAEAA